MKSNFTLPLKLSAFFLVYLLAFTTNSYSQDTNITFGVAPLSPATLTTTAGCTISACTANDVNFGTVYLGDNVGNQATLAYINNPVNGLYIWVPISNNSTKHDLMFQFDFLVGGVRSNFDCTPFVGAPTDRLTIKIRGAVITAGSKYRMAQITGYTVGLSLEFKNIYLGWQAPGQAIGPTVATNTIACDTPKCSNTLGAGIIIKTPLFANFTTVQSCTTGAFEQVVYTSTSTGIVTTPAPSPTTYLWAFPGAATVSPVSLTTAGPYTVTYASAGNKSATLTLTDPSGQVPPSTKTVNTINVLACCTNPVITGMTTSICTGGNFTVIPADGVNGTVPLGTTYSWELPVAPGITGLAAGTNQANISGILTNTTNAPINVVYTVTPKSGNCTGSTFTVTVTVNPNNTAATPSTTPTLCINTVLTAITHATTGATGIGAPTGLPTGVTAAWNADVITISGTPTIAGTFNYNIPLTGGCGTVSATGTIIVTPDNTVTPPSTTPTLCINTVLTAITHTTTGATGIGAPTGLPTGVTAAWNADVITISGTPTIAGTFNYNIPLTGGCGTVSATGTITVTTNNTAGLPSTTPTLCINTVLTPITHATTGATGIGAPTGLPTGVTAAWNADVITISGTPTIAGTFNYNIPLTGGCGTVSATGTIIVTPDNTVTPPSTTPTLCINTVLTAITHTTTGATGIGAPTGLPTGVTAAWNADVITISGTPTIAGTFNYNIPLTGGCGTVSATGTIIVTPDNTVTPPSTTPTLCINTVLTAITHTTTGATGIGAPTGLPTGVTAAWNADVITISGTPTIAGTFNYNIPLTGGCGTVSATGTITVTTNNTAGLPSTTPTLCINTVLTPITHATTGATGIGAPTGLPTGVTAAWNADVITISGTPTIAGTFNYNIPLTGGCGTVSATGTIIVTPDNTVTPPSTTPTLCINTVLTAITHTTTGATGIGAPTGLPTGVTAAWNADVITISGTPTIAGTFNYNIPLTGGCGTVSATGTIIVTPDNTVTPPSTTPTLCINTVLTAITHTTTGATGIGAPTGLPTGVTAAWNADVITISGTPTIAGTFNYNIPLTGGCGTVSATGTITVTTNNTAGLPSTTPTLCINTVLTPITHATTGATGIGAPTGLPTGVTAAWNADVITISGTPTIAGTFNYNIPLTGGCGTVSATGTIIVTPDNTVTPPSTTPTLCINTVLTAITHTTTGATGIGAPTGLPTGVTAAWNADVITISGTPTIAGTFNYNIPLTGGCGTVSATGTIIVTPDNTVTPPSTTPTLCINTVLTAITHTTTGATGIGAPTGLPTGVTAAWNADVITISGTPTIAGTFNYNIPLTGGCGTVSATGTITVTTNNTAGLPSTTPTLCINTVLTPITHATTGATGIGAPTGLPTGVTAAWNADVITISGTPTIAGTFNYNIPLTGGCGTVSATGTIIVTPDNTVTPPSTTPTLCINTVLTAITHTTTGATGIGAPTGLPTGVTAAWNADVITISGTPTIAGTFNYNIPLTGGCGTVSATGTIIVTPDNTVTPPSTTPTLCINTVLTAITHTTTGATGIGAPTGLPTGVTAAWNADVITISGTPTIAGTFNYNIPLTGGCGTVSATGTITVTTNNTAGLPSTTPTLCINTVLTPITHATTGATGIGAPTGLPTGVTAAWNADVITISGTPTIAGTFNYNIPLTGGCGTVSATGTIIVTPDNTVTPPSATPTLCINTVLTAITHTTTGATGIGAPTGLPTGVTAAWNADVITISGTPTIAGTFNYNIPLTGGCGTVSATGTIIVTPDNTVTPPSTTPTLCINTVLTAITHTTTGATGIGAPTGLPTGVTAAWNADVITISGTPTIAGTFNYNIPLTGGCGTVSATGTITVTTNNTAGLPSTTPTLCINTVLTPITHATTGATGIGAPTGLPTGVTAAWNADVITISGTPTIAGTFNYNIPLTGGCGTVSATGTIIVTPDNTVTPPSTTPTLCINTVLTAITHTTTGATGIGAPTGLPTGVTAAWNADVITISGTPTIAGTFNYNIPLTGGCGTVSATGTIIVTPDNTVTPPSTTPTLCINTVLTAITHTTTGATGIGAPTGLPTGVTAAWNADVITISGTPTIAGTFNYNIPLTGGCGTVSATGTITVTTNNTAGLPSTTPTLCINTVLTPITHATTGATGIGAPTGLPTGVTAAWNADVITISGTPTIAGTFNYNIPLTGGCGTVSATGTIIVTPDNTVTPPSTTPTLCINTVLTAITHTTTGATGIGAPTGLPTGVTAAWNADVITISGTPTIAGTFNYNIPLTGGCGTVSATGTIIVTPDNTVTPPSTTPTLCINTVLTAITHTTTGATGIGAPTGLPTGVTAAWNADVITISGTPTIAGTFNYNIPLTGGCGTVSATGTITVTTNNTAGLPSTTPTLCINTVLTPITHATTGATGIGAPTGLPTGVTAAWNADVITISGTPTIAGTFNYNIPLTGGCGTVSATGTIIVTPDNTVTSPSATPTLCINTVLTAITHTTTGATGIGAPTGLPTGVTAAWNADVITISGTPTIAGTFNYNIPLTGGCGTVSATGTIIVTPAPTMTCDTAKTICSGDTVGLLLTSVVPSTYSWIAIANPNVTGESTTAQSSATITDILVNTTTSVQTVIYTVTPTSITGGCVGASQTVTITVNPAPTMTCDTSKTICSGDTVGLLLTSVVPSTYTWVASANANVTGESTTTQTTSTITDILINTTNSVQTVIYTVTPTSITGHCVGAAQTVAIKVNPAPTMTCETSKTICSGDAIGLTLTSVVPSTYTWVATANANVTGESTTVQSTSTITDILVNTTTSVQTVIYTVTPTSITGHCVGAAQIVTITVNPVPVCSIAGSDGPLCPSSTANIYTAPAGMSSYAWSVTGNATINGSTTSQTVSITAGSNCGASFTLTLTIKDNNGCKSTCTKIIMVEDTTLPTFTRPADIIIYADASCEYNATPIKTGDVTNEQDSCSTTIQATYTDVTTAGTCEGSHIITRTWSLKDACGNKAPDQVQTITVKDNTAPIISKPAANLIVECDGNGNNTALSNWLTSHGGATATDNCSQVTWTNNFDKIDADCSAAVTVEFTATDACGNKTTTSATFTIEDTIAPTWSTGAGTLNATIECSDAQALTAAQAKFPMAADNCDGDLSNILKTSGAFVPASASCGNAGTYTNTWIVKDDCGNTSATFTQIITIQDTTAPTWSTPIGTLNVTVECSDADALATAQANVPVASDNCDSDLSNVVKTSGAFIASETCGNAGTYTNTWIVKDDCGNTSETFTQVITIQDTTVPTWTTLAGTLDVTIECSDAAALTTAQGKAPVAKDNCDGDVTNITKISGAFVASGTCGNAGTYTNTWSVKDDCGNTSETFTQVITIQDTTVPTWTTLAGTLDTTIECSDADSLATAQGKAPVASDNCDGDVTNITKTSGAFVAAADCGNAGTYTNTWTVKDDCGNTSESFTQVITIQDTTVPTWTTAAGTLNVTLQCSDAEALATAQGKAPVASDNCDAEVTLTKTSGVFVASESCSNTGTYTNTWIATDNCGNATAVFTQVITIEDTTKPTFNGELPVDLTVSCDKVPQPATITATDNCNTDVPVVYTETKSNIQNECATNYTLTRKWTTSDCGSNTTTYTQVITVKDTTAPTGTAPADITLQNIADIPVADPKAVLNATDNCSATVTVTVSDTNNGGTGCVGTPYILTRTYTLSDCAGNKTLLVQTITVQQNDASPASAINSPVCNGDTSTVNLFNILPRSTTTTGTWIDTNNSNALNGSTVTSFGLAVGTYTFEYQIKDEACPRSLFVNLVVNDDCVVLACGNILVHNAFSPNGDNFNDKFVIDNIDQTACYPENTVEIYNRWGVLVFETKDYNNTTNAFDGFSRGRTTISAPSGLPAGTYFYILNYTAVDGNGAIQTHKKDGYLYLSR